MPTTFQANSDGNVNITQSIKPQFSFTVDKDFFTFPDRQSVPYDFTGKCYAKKERAFYWLKGNSFHNESGPALVGDNGDVKWLVNGKYHCVTGPAVTYADGKKEWFINGISFTEEQFDKHIAKLQEELELETKKKIEEENEAAKIVAAARELKAFEEKSNALKEKIAAIAKKSASKTIPVYANLFEVPHNFTGHCNIESINACAWFKNKTLHRLDGPAVKFFNGKEEWWVDGVKVTEQVLNDLKNGKVGMVEADASYLEKEKEEQKVYPFDEQANLPHYANCNHVPYKFNGWCSIGDWKRICRYENGVVHNLDGPATYSFDKQTEDYYINGIKIYNKTAFECCSAVIEHNKNKTIQEAKKAIHEEVNAEPPPVFYKRKRTVSPPLDTPQPVASLAEAQQELAKPKATNSTNSFTFQQSAGGHWVTITLPTTASSTTSYYISNQENKEMAPSTVKSVATDFLTTLKSDGKEAAKRTAARKLTKIAQEFLVNLMTSGVKGKQLLTMKDSIRENLNSEHGKAVLGITMGSILPQFKQMLPEKHHPLVEEMATEFRVEGLSVIGDIVTAFMTGPAFSMLQSGVVGVFDELTADNSDAKVRVAGDLTAGEASPKLDTADERETAKVSALRR